MVEFAYVGTSVTFSSQVVLQGNPKGVQIFGHVMGAVAHYYPEHSWIALLGVMRYFTPWGWHSMVWFGTAVWDPPLSSPHGVVWHDGAAE